MVMIKAVPSRTTWRTIKALAMLCGMGPPSIYEQFNLNL